MKRITKKRYWRKYVDSDFSHWRRWIARRYYGYGDD